MKNADRDGSSGEQSRHGFKDVNAPLRLHSTDLDDRQRRAVKLWLEADDADGLVMTINDGLTVWFSSTDPTRAYQVARKFRNRRGVLNFEYACQCADFGKNGRIDCMHILAEKLRRGEVIIDGAVGEPSTTASRRPPRDVRAIDGTPARTALRKARVDMPFQIHRLINSLVASSPAPPHRKRRGGQLTEAACRAATLLHKVVEGCSADTMISRYQALIDDGILALSRPPHQNTLSAWMNDSHLTPILSTWLPRTASPFRACEVGGIIDSSKVSQMRTAHPRHVDYGNDVRDAADWMKVHTLVGVNTLVVMAARFSGSRGEGTGDPAFLVPLVSDALAVFRLKYVLGDKAYLAEKLLGWLWERSIRAVIPLKKRTDPSGWVEHPEAAAQLAKWYDDDQRSFHEVYRLRPKVESLFSAMKRVTSDYCWSRGRQRSEVKNADEPCVAWVNETLCKLIYMNLRTTVFYEVLTSCTIDYRHPERCFPPLTNAVLAA